jgi:hypothetical protein
MSNAKQRVLTAFNRSIDKFLANEDFCRKNAGDRMNFAIFYKKRFTFRLYACII